MCAETARNMRLPPLFVLMLSTGVWGCATRTANFAVQMSNDPVGSVRYEAPRAGPYDDLNSLVDTACKHMKAQPADKGPPPGYCALLFHAPLSDSPSPGEKWFIPHVAPIRVTNELERSCLLPVDPVEPKSAALLILDSGPTGPQPPTDRVWSPTSFLNRMTGRTWEHDVLVFSLEAPSTCAVYSFSGFSGVVTRREGNTFVPVGAIDNGQGVLQTSANKTSQ